ncbi:hypothetical protein ACJX0J_025401, partial [Zea mays]
MPVWASSTDPNLFMIRTTIDPMELISKVIVHHIQPLRFSFAHNNPLQKLTRKIFNYFYEAFKIVKLPNLSCKAVEQKIINAVGLKN